MMKFLNLEFEKITQYWALYGYALFRKLATFIETLLSFGFTENEICVMALFFLFYCDHSLTDYLPEGISDTRLEWYIVLDYGWMYRDNVTSLDDRTLQALVIRVLDCVPVLATIGLFLFANRLFKEVFLLIHVWLTPSLLSYIYYIAFTWL